MVLEFLTPVAGWAVGKTADAVWGIATDQVKTKLQQTDVERAIQAGLAAIRQWEETLSVPELVFKGCDDKQKRQFLNQAFSHAGVVEQLQRPLMSQGELDLALMQAYFEAVAKATGVDLTVASLPRWLEIFGRTYFEKNGAVYQIRGDAAAVSQAAHGLV